MSAEARLKELGLVLPVLPRPVADYLHRRRRYCFLSGHGPRTPTQQRLPASSAPRSASMKATARPARRVRTNAAMPTHWVRWIVSTSSSNCSGSSMRRRISMMPRWLFGPVRSRCSVTPDGTPARRSAMSCCLTRFRSKSRVSLRSRHKGRPRRMRSAILRALPLRVVCREHRREHAKRRTALSPSRAAAPEHAFVQLRPSGREPLSSHRGFLSRSLGWLIAGIWFLFQVILIAWATLAIYYSNLPWAGLRLALAVAFAAFAIWALWLSRRRRMSVVFIVLFLGVVAWWISIPPSHDRSGDRKSR